MSCLVYKLQTVVFLIAEFYWKIQKFQFELGFWNIFYCQHVAYFEITDELKYVYI